MTFLRTLFWIVLTAVVVVFAFNNWVAVRIALYGGLLAEVKLPILLLIAFLAGLVPMWLYHRARLWQAQRRLETAERALAIATPPAASIDSGGPPPAPLPSPLRDPPV